MEVQEAPPVAVRKPALTPKALIHQRYGKKACYKIEEMQLAVENGCPGLVVPQQSRCMYRCSLDLPELSVTSDTFTRKKDAEQSAAEIAIEKLGIYSTPYNPTPQEADNELIARLSSFFTDEFLSSSHPLIGHIRESMRRTGDHFGLVPISAVAACDAKVNNLCKTINPKAESDPFLAILLIMKAALSASVLTNDGGLWISKRNTYSPEAMSLKDHNSLQCIEIRAVLIPCSVEEHVKSLTIDISSNQYYMEVIAEKLGIRDSSQLIVSRTVGKASSEMKFYFPCPDVHCLASNSPVDIFSDAENNVKLDLVLNKRASYLSGQNIYGEAVLANVGYTWKSSDLFFEDVSLCSYYRMLLCKVPDGQYKLSRGAVLAAELPTTYTSRLNWIGPSPRDLLFIFCRQHRLPEPLFSVKRLSSLGTRSQSSETWKNIIKVSKLNNVADVINRDTKDAVDGESGTARNFRCEVKILSRMQDSIVECSFDNSYRKEADAIQNTALRVLTLLKKYFEQGDMPIEKLHSAENKQDNNVEDINIYPKNFYREFATFLSIYGGERNIFPRNCRSLGSMCTGQTNNRLGDGRILFDIEGPESGVFPSPGSLTCIAYAVALVKNGEPLKETLESKDEFEFELGAGSVINQIETCVVQLSVNQSARFVTELPSSDLILAAAGEYAERLSQLSLDGYFLEYSVKVLRVTEALEDRMEQALFSPPLSKQRVDFAVRHINESLATTLVDFGCGSGSLLDALLNHPITLEKMVGVDISRKGLSRAAKILHSKLSENSGFQANIKSAVLYDGSITDFDSRLYGSDIGTCLEVIEHMEEDQACLFGDVVLSLFCPKVLIVSTPNYDYNPVLQRSSLSRKEDESEERSEPCRFRNHDHKFEWTREQFEQWASSLGLKHSYSVEFSGVGGSADVEPGYASQIAVFRRSTSHRAEKYSNNEDSSQPYQVIWEWTNKSRSSSVKN